MRKYLLLVASILLIIGCVSFGLFYFNKQSETQKQSQARQTFIESKRDNLLITDTINEEYNSYRGIYLNYSGDILELIQRQETVKIPTNSNVKIVCISESDKNKYIDLSTIMSEERNIYTFPVYDLKSNKSKMTPYKTEIIYAQNNDILMQSYLWVFGCNNS